MKNTEGLVKSIVLSAFIAVVIIVLLTIGGELNPALKNWLTITFSHHWIGKGVLSIFGFFFSALIFYFLRLKNVSLTLLVWLLVIFANLSVAVVVLFFLVETFFL